MLAKSNAPNGVDHVGMFKKNKEAFRGRLS